MNRYGPRKIILAVSVALVFQVFDFYPWYSAVNLSRWEYKFPLKSSSWNNIINHSSQINFIPPKRHWDEYIPFALQAANKGKVINVGYTARRDKKKRRLYQKQLTEEFENGHLRDDVLYVIMNTSLVRESYPSHKVGMLDGYLIVAPNVPIPDLKPWPLTFKDGEKNRISQVIEHYSESNHIILMSAKDKAARKLPDDFKKFLRKKGGRIDTLKFRSPYIAVIHDGVLKYERLGERYKKVGLTASIGNYRINMISAGMDSGNKSVIDVNGISLSPDKNGLNIVIINPEYGNALIYHYDTHEKLWDYKLPEKEITLLP